MSSVAIGQAGYCELAVMSNFSFLRGASHPEELIVAASRLGLCGIALTDRNTLAGTVRAHMAAREAGLRYQPGCRLSFTCGAPDCLVYPADIKGWNSLCRLLSLGNRRASKGDCLLALDDLLAGGEGLLFALLPRDITEPAEHAAASNALQRLSATFPGRVWLAAGAACGPRFERDLAARMALAGKASLPLLATNDVLYHRPERRRLQDVVTCIREGLTLAGAGRRLEAHCERHLKHPAEMARLWRACPQAIAGNAATVFAALLLARRVALPISRRDAGKRPDLPGGTGAPGPCRRHQALSVRSAAARPGPDTPRASAHRGTGLCALFPDGRGHRAFCPEPGNPVPGAGFGRQFDRLLLHRHYRCRSGAHRPPVRAVHLAGAPRTAGHRR